MRLIQYIIHVFLTVKPRNGSQGGLLLIAPFPWLLVLTGTTEEMCNQDSSARFQIRQSRVGQKWGKHKKNLRNRTIVHEAFSASIGFTDVLFLFSWANYWAESFHIIYQLVSLQVGISTYKRLRIDNKREKRRQHYKFHIFDWSL